MSPGILEHKKRMLLLLSGLLVVGFLSTSLVSYFVSLASLRNQINNSTLPLTSDNIYSEIQRDLLRPTFISSLMAHDTFLRDWILGGEKDGAQVCRYLKEIMEKYHTFTSFLVSEKTRVYYHADGILKTVSPQEPRDAWYFRVRKMAPDFETNVDPDLANNDAMTIFINYKVYDYEDNYIGVTGVGLTIYAVVTLMEEYSKKYNRNIFFADSTGRIVLKSSSFSDSAHCVQNMAGLSQYADSILNNERMQLNYQKNGQLVHLNTRFVPELKWYLFVEQTETQAVRPINHALVVNLFLCFVITAVVLLLALLVINTFQKVTQKQQQEILEQHDNLMIKHKELEKALSEKLRALDQNQLLMKEMNHRVKNNLSMIQSLLRIQSRKVEHQPSRMALLDSESRLRSISNIHRMLSESTDLSHIDINTYVNQLVNDLMINFDVDKSKVQVEMEIASIQMDLNLLIPLSLVLNELVTNAFKYAFENESNGLLRILIRRGKEGKTELVVQDNGKGLPADYDFEHAASLGAEIVSMLVEQIGGVLHIESQTGEGSRFQIIF